MIRADKPFHVHLTIVILSGAKDPLFLVSPPACLVPLSLRRSRTPHSFALPKGFWKPHENSGSFAPLRRKRSADVLVGGLCLGAERTRRRGRRRYAFIAFRGPLPSGAHPPLRMTHFLFR